MSVDLTGKVAVVTGGGGVLAGKFALELAKAGAKVAVLDINGEAAEATALNIRDNGSEAISVACSVLDKQSMEEAEKKIFARFGGYQILINAAGGNSDKVSTTSEQYSEEDVTNPDAISFFDFEPRLFNNVVQLNLMGTIIPTQVFAKKMLLEKDPVIINISSMTSFDGLTKVCAYGAAKAAINNITKWLAVYFGNTKIRVNAIAPGFMITHQNEKMLTNPDGTLTERSKKIIAHTPMKRMGTADDLTGTLLFLCDAENSGYVTGVIIPVDGGFMAAPGV